MVSQTEKHAGEVSRVSGNGFQLKGEARWYNLSKFVNGLKMPAVGDAVEISLNKGYVVQIAKRSGPPPTEAARPAVSPSRAVSRPPEPPPPYVPPSAEEEDLPFDALEEEPPFINPSDLGFNEPLQDALDDVQPDVRPWDFPPALESGALRLPEKDVQIVRMNAVTNAVAILSSGGRACEPEAVLTLAAQLESWVTR